MSKTTTTGKKRKNKKSKKEKECENPKGTSKTVNTADKDSPIPLASALTVNKIEGQCSSSSSIESHKPVLKIPRFEEVWSDGMSVEKVETKPNKEQPSDVVMDSGTESSLASKSPPVEKLPPSPLIVKEPGVPPTVASFNVDTIANLRWINQCANEEKEEERIEQYKHDRRERYKKEILLRKEQTGTAERRRQYYSTTVK